MNLYGRAHEQWAIAETLHTVRRGQSTLILLDGPRGSGKSTLLERIAEVAPHRGFSVTTGSFDTYRSLLIAKALTGDAGGFAADDGHRRRRRRDTPRRLDPIDEIIGSAVVTDAPPALVALDDVVWADPLVQRSIRGLMPVSARRVLWMLAGAGTAPNLPGEPGAANIRRLTLGPLGCREVDQMAVDRLGALPDPALTRLFEACGGHPGLLTAVFDRLATHGGHRVRDGVAHPAADPLPHEVLTGLLEADPRLSARARALAATIAATPHAIDVAEFTHLPGESSVPQLEALCEAVDAGVLVVDGGRLGFRHPLLHDAAALLAAGPVETGALSGTALPAPVKPKHDPLSATERNIVRLVANGLTNSQIASRVALSPHTVNFHLRKIFRKTGVSSRVELAGVHRLLLQVEE